MQTSKKMKVSATETSDVIARSKVRSVEELAEEIRIKREREHELSQLVFHVMRNLSINPNGNILKPCFPYAEARSNAESICYWIRERLAGYEDCSFAIKVEELSVELRKYLVQSVGDPHVGVI